VALGAEGFDIFTFDHSYARLPGRFYARVQPTHVSAPRLIRVNEALARHLNLDPAQLASPEGLEVLAGNRMPNDADPLAMAYAGHQFGGFVPQLGDGRAILLGEIIARDGQRYDVQLKGAGRTPFSRSGDGRAALGPVMREYILSEAMAALGIPTTRALAAVLTGDTVMRDGPLPGAVFTRVASCHIRIGTFQFFAAREDVEGVRILADYVIARHYPEAREMANPYRSLLDAIVARQAALVARWLLVGFIHGVMNTDNMTISGETIDYGPCAFMDAYRPDMVYSSIDRRGRYAYGNQPAIAQWNLTRLAETLLPLWPGDEANAVNEVQDSLGTFADIFEAAYAAGLNRKLGLKASCPENSALARDLLAIATQNGADFTLTFRGLADVAANPHDETTVRRLFADPNAFDAWLARWRQRLSEEGGNAAERAADIRAVNPAFIPRNHLVEEAIAAAVTEDDFSLFEDLLSVLSAPYTDQPAFGRYAAPPRPEQIVHQTFCGT